MKHFLLRANTAFRVEDSSSTQQLISGGDILRVLGTSNEIVS